MWQLEDFQRLFVRLRTSGLPLAYCQNTVSELMTQRDLSIELGRGGDMGNVDSLAERFVDTYRDDALLTKHPRLLLFGLGLIVTVLVWLAGIILAFGLFYLVNRSDLEAHHVSQFLLEEASLLSLCLEFLPFVVAGIAMRCLAIRSGGGWTAHLSALFWPFLLILGSQVNLEL